MSVNAVDQTTGDISPLAGNTNNLVGNLSALTTNTQSDAVGAINEVNAKANANADEIDQLKSGLTNLHYHKIAESADSGTRASKLESLYATYTALSLDKRKSAILVKNNNDIFQPVNGTGAFSITYVADQTILLITYLLNPGTYIYALNGTITDASSEENSEVFSLWVCE